MKIKLEGKGLPKLKGKEDYRKWKKDVEILMMALGTKYLLKHHIPAPPTTPPTQAQAEGGEGGEGGSDSSVTNISSRKGKGRVIVDDDDDEEERHISRERWVRESESVVAQLYFFVESTYQSIIHNLSEKDLPTLFAKLDSILLNNNMMVVMAKRGELEDIRFKVDSTFLQQIAKWEEVFIQYIEMGGEMSPADKATNFAKSLPFQYRKQLSDALESLPPPHLFDTMKEKISSIYMRESAWKILPHLNEGGAGLDTSLYGYEVKKKPENQNQKPKSEQKGGWKPQTEKSGDTPNKTADVQCFNCGKKGHSIKKCRHPISNEAKQKLEAYKKKKTQERAKKFGEKKEEKHTTCLAFDVCKSKFIDVYSPHTFTPPKIGCFNIKRGNVTEFCEISQKEGDMSIVYAFDELIDDGLVGTSVPNEIEVGKIKGVGENIPFGVQFAPPTAPKELKNKCDNCCHFPQMSPNMSPSIQDDTQVSDQSPEVPRTCCDDITTCNDVITSQTPFLSCLSVVQSHTELSIANNVFPPISTMGNPLVMTPAHAHACTTRCRRKDARTNTVCGKNIATIF